MYVYIYIYIFTHTHKHIYICAGQAKAALAPSWDHYPVTFLVKSLAIQKTVWMACATRTDTWTKYA